jgi:hypothetical protein
MSTIITVDPTRTSVRVGPAGAVEAAHGAGSPSPSRLRRHRAQCPCATDAHEGSVDSSADTVDKHRVVSACPAHVAAQARVEPV